MKYTPLSILVLMALLLSSGTALAQKGTEPGSPPSDISIAALPPYTVRIAVPIEDGSTDPVDPAFYGIGTVSDQLFSGLTRIDPATAAPIADLAASWTHNPNSSVFTFTLRSGLKWSNGTAITAANVRDSILRSLDPATGSPYAYMLYSIQKAAEFNTGSASAAQVGITVLSTTQVKFTLTGPAAYFPAVLATPPARIVPVSVINTWGPAWTEPAHIVTSGPYRLTEWLPGERFQLEKFTGFYGAASVKVLHITAFQLDEYDAWSLFFAGGLDTVQVPLSEVAWVKADPTWGPLLHSQQGSCTYYYGFSTSQAPFDDPLVRKAFIAAINRQGLIDNVVGGGEVAQTFTPPGYFGHVDGVGANVGIPYNVTDAQDYLATAGYPGGSGLPAITLWYNTSPGHQAIAEYVRQNWIDNLGVTVTLQDMAWADYQTFVATGGAQIWRLGWCADYNDAYNWLHDAVVYHMGDYYGGWSNTAFTDELGQAAQADNNTDRLGHYAAAEEILVEGDAVMAPLYYYTTPILTRAYLQRPYAVETHIRDWQILTTTDTLSSTGAEDGWVLESGETTNVGGTLNAGSGTLFIGDNAQDKQYRGILSFDTSGLPNNAVITSAVLKVKGAGLVGTNPFTTHGNLLVDLRFGAFSANQDLQTRDFQASPSLSAVMTIGKTPVSGWYSATMPTTKLGYINRNGVTQFRLRFTKDDNDDLSADYLKFYSGDAVDPLSYPKLIIKYYAP